MQSIGRNEAISVPGLCTPTIAMMRPSVAAMLYAGAVDETAITTLEIRPSDPARRPLPPGAAAGPATTGPAPASTAPAGTATAGFSTTGFATTFVITGHRLPPGHLGPAQPYRIAIPYSRTGFRYRYFRR